MGFKCGMIGLPNVGKSTLFNILTNSDIPAKNFPFCTIKPNIGFSSVFDYRLNKIISIVQPKKIITSFMEFVDIAGLVKGASKGCGLGNQFLSNIHRVDLLVHVVRCFQDENIIHIHNAIDPLYDIDIINMELILSDLQLCEKEISKLKKNNEMHNSKNKILNKFLYCLNSGNFLNTLHLDSQELKLTYGFNFITLKPMMYIANISDNTNNIFLSNLLNFCSKKNNICIPIHMLKESENEYLKLNHIKNLSFKSNCISKINQIIQTGYKLLNLQNFFTVGKKEVKSWTVKAGTTSIQAARKIHTDFEKGFIRAQVISYNDFIKFKDDSKLRKFGKIRLEGKNYLVQDGDIIHFLFKV